MTEIIPAAVFDRGTIEQVVDNYAFSPSVWPIYANENVLGKIEMQALAVNVEPYSEGFVKEGAQQSSAGGNINI